MKLLFENWRKYLNEKRWQDYEAPKDQWTDVPVADIAAARDALNIDLSDELYSLVDNAYKGIGGHYDYQSAADIPGNDDDWLAMDWDEDPEPDVLRVGRRQPHGVKLTAAGHDGQAQSKRAYVQKTIELMNTPGYYAEMSKRIADIMISAGTAYVDDPDLVQKVLGPSKPIQWIGDHPEGKYPEYKGWYRRPIGGRPGVLKIMFGSPR